MSYTSSDIKDLLGVKVDRLQDWVNRGYIKPSVQQASGQGTKNLYSRDDLVLIELFKRLVAQETLREAAGRIVKAIRDCDQPIDRYFLYARLAIGPDSSGITEYHTIKKMISIEDMDKPLKSIMGDDFDLARYQSDLTKPVPATDFNTTLIINMKKIIDFVDSKIG